MTTELMEFVGHEKLIIHSLVVILCTSTVVALISQRLRIALIPAYLIAGVIIGPSGLALVRSSGALEEIGHLAVVLLLFGIGMELHLSALRKEAFTLLGTSISSCVLSIFAIFLIGILCNLSAPTALAIAMAFSLSSTALVLRLLSVSRELTRGHGQLSLAILVTQDLLVLFMLAAVPFLAQWQGGDSSLQASLPQTSFTFVGSLTTAGVLLAIFVVGQKVLPKLLLESLRERSTEVLMLTAVSAALLSAYLTQKLGFSLEMGAFLMGFLLASSPFRHQLAGQVSPLRNLFMAVFFTVLGTKLNLETVLQNFFVIGIGTAALLLVKTACIFAAAWLFGVHSRIAILAALMLAQAGEFSLIVLDKSSEFKILTTDQTAIFIGMVVVSLIATPALFKFSNQISKYFEALPSPPWIKELSAQSSEKQLLSATGEHVIVAGYGPVGRAVTKNLVEIGIPYTVVELNPSTVRKEKAAGTHIVYGDLANEAVLEAVGINGARALVITFSDPKLAIDAASKARLLNQDVEIIARANSLLDQKQLEQSEVDRAIIDEESSARIMVELSRDFNSARKD